MIVMKFGGTSTQDAAAQRNVAQIVESRLSQQPVVVISAIARGTNALERAGRLASIGDIAGANAAIDELLARHYAIIEENISSPEKKAEIRAVVASAHAELKERITGVAILRELTPKTLDGFYCYGELLSSRLVAAALQEHGVNARWLDTKDFLVTDANHTFARPRMEIVTEKLRRIVDAQENRGVTFVTQGFIGVTDEGVRTTMGRESSDYSAAVVAAALNAADVQIWTDVDGILTGDPNMLPKASKVKEMSFQEAYDLCFYGAKVLHPSTMLPALERQIPIHIYNSRRAHLSGSCVAAAIANGEPCVKSVASKTGLTLIRVAPLQRTTQYGFWEQAIMQLARHGVQTRAMTSTEYEIAFAVDSHHLTSDVVIGLEQVGTLETRPNQALVTIVGASIRRVPDLLPRISKTLRGVEVGMTTFGASGCSLTFMVDESSAASVVKQIHAEFFEGDLPASIFERLTNL
jgi:aspartate kinase